MIDAMIFYDGPCLLGGELPANRKWVITPVINGIFVGLIHL